MKMAPLVERGTIFVVSNRLILSINSVSSPTEVRVNSD